MAKKIILGTINNESLEKLSGYHKAHLELKGLREIYKKDLGKLQEEEAKILEDRQHDIDAGIPTDTAISKHSTEKVHEKMRKLESKYKKDCEPWNESKKQALKLLDSNLYYAYVLAMTKGDLSAKGSVDIKKGKSTETYKLEKGYKSIIEDFLTEIGCKGQDNDTALSKFAQIMSVRTAGMRKNNKGEDYVTVKSASQFNELFMLSFLQYVIREKGVVTVNEDGTLSMTVYED